MKKTHKTANAFTLAEVLTALTIIGVVSALTIPTLVQKTNKQEYVSALQKAYSTLSQAANMIIAENGSPKCADGGWACSPDQVSQMFRKYLNNIKECSGDSNKGCWNESYKFLSGGSGDFFRTRSIDRKFILADGSQVLVDASLSGSCGNVNYGSSNFCSYIHVDVNGNKKPNQWGKDVFVFALKEDGIHPMGCDNPDNINACSTSGYGYGCACKVIREGRMDY